MAVDWLAIKTEYINGGISYRKLAEKYGVSQSTIRKRAATEKWADLREEQRNKIGTKTEQKTAEKISDALSEEAAAKSRIRARIYHEIEKRLSAEDVGSADFRRLVQSFKDMCEIVADDGKDTQEGVRVIIDV